MTFFQYKPPLFKVCAVIPARLSSTRFPKKLLYMIENKSILQRTYEQVKQAESIEEVVIAVDSQELMEHVTSFGAKAIMTKTTHINGTSRITEVLEKKEEIHQCDIIVNVQGDEPCINPQTIDRLVRFLEQNLEAQLATPIIRLNKEHEIHDKGIAKCVINQKNEALYFSRSAIPFIRNVESPPPPIYGHLGVYAFRKDFLLTYYKLPETPLMSAESLEQLKILEHGYTIHTVIVEDPILGVDFEEDIYRVQQWLNKQNISL